MRVQLGLFVNTSDHSVTCSKPDARMATKKLVPMPYPFPVEEELKKNPQIKVSDIQTLMEWCEKQPHLPKITDEMLIMALHSNYYSTEAAKTTIENFFTIRTHTVEFFSKRDPLGSKELRQAFNTAHFSELPALSKKGYNVILGSLVDCDPAHYIFDDITKYYFMVTDLICIKNGTRDGYIVIYSAHNAVLTHALKISPVSLKKMVLYVQEAIPIRLKGIHVINAAPIMDILMSMLRPLMKKETSDLIHVHTSLKTLEEHVSVDLLPNEFGGKGGPESKLQEKHIKEIDSKREWFLEEEKHLRVNESLRIGKSVTAHDLFGIEGTFKKIEID